MDSFLIFRLEYEMKKLLAGFVYIFFALTFAGTALGAEKGTAEEAVSMVKKAIDYLKKNGKEKAFAEFSNGSGPFKDRDLYITVMDTTGKMLVHGANPKLNGKNLIDMKDADGKYFVKEYIELAKSKGTGWIDFKWPNPVTQAIEQKSVYFEKVDDVVVTCGVYK